MILLNLFRLFVTDAVDIIRHIVHTVMNRYPERKGRFRQRWPGMGLHSLLKLPHVLGRGVHTSHKSVAGDAILLILCCHTRAHRLGRTQLLTFLKLGHVLTHIGEGNGGNAGEHTASIIMQKSLHTRWTGRMPLKQSCHIIHRPLDYNPVLSSTFLHCIQRVDGTFLTEQYGDESENPHKEGTCQKYHEANSHLFTPCLLRLSILLSDTCIRDGEGQTTTKVVPPHCPLVIIRHPRFELLGLLFGSLIRSRIVADITDIILPKLTCLGG
mmetsp:Transcript_24837/g.37483  ORF Transcript_24837/g.37483 Transcript_24837/m.37483 type:complete len:269 (-) Transcript_24837:85-891(-)